MDRRIATGRARTSGGMAAITAAAAAATVAGHDLAFRLTYLDGSQRALTLARTGHSYWPSAVRVALVLAVVGLTLQIARGTVAALSKPPAVLSLVARVAPIQLGLFTLMEAVERMVEHEPPSAFLAERTFWVGVVVQLALALLVSVILRVACRAGEVLQRFFSITIASTRGRVWVSADASDCSAAQHGSSWRTRAPPAVAAIDD